MCIARRQIYCNPPASVSESPTKAAFGLYSGRMKSRLNSWFRLSSEPSYQPGHDIAIALDFAANELYEAKFRALSLRLEDRRFKSDEFSALIRDWCHRYPIVSIEDPMADTDVAGWQAITSELGASVQIVGDDLFTTNVERIQHGADRKTRERRLDQTQPGWHGLGDAGCRRNNAMRPAGGRSYQLVPAKPKTLSLVIWQWPPMRGRLKWGRLLVESGLPSGTSSYELSANWATMPLTPAPVLFADAANHNV